MLEPEEKKERNFLPNISQMSSSRFGHGPRQVTLPAHQSNRLSSVLKVLISLSWREPRARLR